MRSVLIVMSLWLGCLAGRSGIMPVPEGEQAARAADIIDSYHGPRPPSPTRKLRIVYFTPSDRDPAPRYEQRLGAIMEDIHDFYRDGMKRLGFGAKSFAMERDSSGKLIFHLVKGARQDTNFTVWPGRAGTVSAESPNFAKP